MGIGSSRDSSVNAKVERKLTDITKLVSKIKTKEVKRGISRFFLISAVLLWLVSSAVLLHRYRKNYFQPLFSSTIQIFSCKAVFIFSVLSLIYDIRIYMLYKKGMILTHELNKFIDTYKSSKSYYNIKKTLKENNEFKTLHYIDDFNCFINRCSSPSEKESLWTRFVHMLANSGPDYEYAVICPVCKSIKGWTARSNLSCVDFKCEHCSSCELEEEEEEEEDK